MEHTTAANSNTVEIRSLRVEGLLPKMDAKYLYGCFSDHGQVVAATVLRNVRTGLLEDYGFVEFSSRRWAEMILKSYNGQHMPNFGQRYRLKWDVDAAGTMWRWDSTYERCSYFGFDDAGRELNAEKAIMRYQHCIPVVTEKPAGKRKPKFINVEEIQPGTSGHTLTVKVASSNPVKVKSKNGDARSWLSSGPLQAPRIAECLVGDETGTVVFTARNDQVDTMKPGTTVILRNAKVDMFKGTMRLAVDKWGRVEVTEPANFEVKEANNLSLIEYELASVAER